MNFFLEISTIWNFIDMILYLSDSVSLLKFKSSQYYNLCVFFLFEEILGLFISSGDENTKINKAYSQPSRILLSRKRLVYVHKYGNSYVYTDMVFIAIELSAGVPKYGNSEMKEDSGKTSGEEDLRG